MGHFATCHNYGDKYPNNKNNNINTGRAEEGHYTHSSPPKPKVRADRLIIRGQILLRSVVVADFGS